MFYVYILLCKDNSLYVGSTNNLEKRLKEHNTSKNGAHYTKIRRPVTLQYHEVCKTYSEVRAREAAIKRLTKDKKLALIQGQVPAE
jgi:putative endonuclease